MAGGLIAAAGTTVAGIVGGVATSAAGALVIPRGYTLMRKNDYLKVLRKTSEQLEKILNKDCD